MPKSELWQVPLRRTLAHQGCSVMLRMRQILEYGCTIKFNSRDPSDDIRCQPLPLALLSCLYEFLISPSRSSGG